MKCQTLIDPETKIALEGEALVAALRQLDPVRCGYELHEDDVFCPSCGKKVLGYPECSAGRTLSARMISSLSSCVLHLIVGTIVAVLCVVALFYCGAAYTYACKWIPISLMFIPLPLMFFAGVPGIVTAMAYRCFKVNRLLLCFVLGVLFGCVAVYGAWFWFVRDLNGIEEWDPFRLWGYAHDISARRVVDVGFRRLGNGIKVTGGVLLFFYYLEALSIIMMSILTSIGWAANFQLSDDERNFAC